ncbi:MAG TPA: hypothetical protein VFU72_07955 [Nitrolancea sp.]|nr:hypothetical protein [Nitrolancea sp.]
MDQTTGPVPGTPPRSARWTQVRAVLLVLLELYARDPLLAGVDREKLALLAERYAFEPWPGERALPEYVGRRGRLVRWSPDFNEGPQERATRRAMLRRIWGHFVVLSASLATYYDRDEPILTVRFGDGLVTVVYAMDVEWLDDDGQGGDDTPAA